MSAITLFFKSAGMKRFYSAVAMLPLLLWIGPTTATSEARQLNDQWPYPWTAKIAIVIDNLGNGMRGTEQLFALHIPLTVAIIPNSKQTEADAANATRTGKEIIAHIPMEYDLGAARWSTEGALNYAMSSEEISRRLGKQLQSLPSAKGVMNHYYSKLNTNVRVVESMMRVVSDRSLYFMDNSGHPNSVAAKVGGKHGVTVVQNALIMDDYYRLSHMKQRLRDAADLSIANGYAVVVGHVGVQGELTVRAIEDSIPYFISHRVKPVLLSEIIEDMKMQQNNTRK